MITFLIDLDEGDDDGLSESYRVWKAAVKT